MESFKEKKVLISGASIAGLSTAYWMNRLGYQVTVVELANTPRTAGAAIDFKGETVAIAKRMGIYDALKSDSLLVEQITFRNADDSIAGLIDLKNAEAASDELEVERHTFMACVYDGLRKDVEFMFNNSIIAMEETEDAQLVTFKDGTSQAFDLVFGCDGLHSGVRKIWFGEETEYAHFLEAYFSITIVNKLLIEPKTMQLFNVPNKAITLNAYKHKTDVIFCFVAEQEIPYHYRDIAAQRKIILEQFKQEGWRTPELLEEVLNDENFYFDKFCQIKMPSWTKGRVALVGDAGYCASPAAGMGASLSMIGAAALADALEKYKGDFNQAFDAYNKDLRPFIDEIQATAERNVRENFIPRTEAAIRKRNAQTGGF